MNLRTLLEVERKAYLYVKEKERELQEANDIWEATSTALREWSENNRSDYDTNQRAN
jgi:hypothetical protein